MGSKMPPVYKSEPPRPLAAAIRPEFTKDVVGQKHLLGPGKPLRLMLDKKQMKSVILWGPAGTGKTTIARAIAKDIDADFYALDATSAGVKELRTLIQGAFHAWEKHNRITIVFVDECLPYNALILCMVDGIAREIPIGLIVEKRIDCDVLTVDVDTNIESWQPIISRSSVKQKSLVDVVIDDNGIEKTLRCSHDHLVFTTNRGYVAASSLTIDDDVILHSKCTGRPV